MSPATSFSSVSKKTRVPSAETPPNATKNGAVPTGGTGGDQRRRPARALVDVGLRVGVGGQQLLVGLEEHAASRHARSRGRSRRSRRSHPATRWRSASSPRRRARTRRTRRPCRPPSAARRSRRRPACRRRTPRRRRRRRLRCPPVDPVESSVVVPPRRSYRSNAASVSPLTSCSSVSKNARLPSADVASKNASATPFPPDGPSEMWSLAEWFAPAPAARAASATSAATDTTSSRTVAPHLSTPSPCCGPPSPRSGRSRANKYKRQLYVKDANTVRISAICGNNS